LSLRLKSTFVLVSPYAISLLLEPSEHDKYFQDLKLAEPGLPKAKISYSFTPVGTRDFLESQSIAADYARPIWRHGKGDNGTESACSGQQTSRMSYHIVSIDSANCSLSCRDGQLTCKTAEGERKLPLEDVASIIITSFSAQIHSHLFLQAAKHGVALIICEAFKPVSLVLPANRSTDTLLTRAVLNLPDKTRQQLWQRTVDAKCENQFALAEHIAPANRRLAEMKAATSGRKPHKEAIVAKSFWQTFGESLGDKEFTRNRAAGGLNSLLNYGYAVLLSTVLQKLFGVGLDPTFGISHVARERSTPLAYDLMEPFRPCVDWRVYQWVKRLNHQPPSQPGSSRRQSAPSDPGRQCLSGLTSAATEKAKNGYEVTKEFRGWVTGFPLERVGYLDFTLEIQGVIEGVVRSFRHAVLSNQTTLYKPWRAQPSKWIS